MINKNINHIIENLNEHIEKDLSNELQNFAKWLEYQGLAENSIISYFNDLKQSILFFANYTQQKISTNWLETIDNTSYIALIANLAQKKSIKTQERTIATWKKWAKFQEQTNKKTNNIFLNMAYPKRTSTILPNIELATIEKLFNEQIHRKKEKFTWQALRNQALLTLLYSSGIRINEALNLKWQDLSCNNENSTQKYYCKILGKGNKIRYVPILPQTQEILSKYKQTLDDNQINLPNIFISNQLKKWHACSVARLFREIIDNDDIKLTPHKLRHACATHLLKSGCSLSTIKALLGHANLETTKLYIQHSTQELMNIHNKIINTIPNIKNKNG